MICSVSGNAVVSAFCEDIGAMRAERKELNIERVKSIWSCKDNGQVEMRIQADNISEVDVATRLQEGVVAVPDIGE